jgi:hypothetical protein
VLTGQASGAKWELKITKEELKISIGTHRDRRCMRKRVVAGLLLAAMAGILFLVLQPRVSLVD